MKNRVIKVVSGIMDTPIEKLDEESSPDTVEKWDSIGHMNLILALEEEFGVYFSGEEIVEMLNVQIIIETLKEKAVQ